MKRKPVQIAFAAVACLVPALAQAEWKPTKTIEFIVTAGPGGGTDQFARTVQAAITKNKLTDANIVVVNKGGGSGAEGFVYGKGAVGDAYKLVFATSNEWMLPMVAKLAFAPADLKPVAAMAFDEFILWGKQGAFADAKSYIAAAAAKPGEMKMGGSQSKDVDQLLTRLLEKATGTKFIYVPFKSGNEAAVQLAGGHIDSNTNNPSENIGQWKAGAGKPLCVFSPERMPAGPKVTATEGWSDIPTCREAGIPLDEYRMPRTIFTPAKVPDDVTAYYVDLLRKVRETAEWKAYLERSAQTDRFLDAAELGAFIAKDEPRARSIFQDEGWLVN
jgi:putative tricarboxylic transport membrane protein